MHSTDTLQLFVPAGAFCRRVFVGSPVKASNGLFGISPFLFWRALAGDRQGYASAARSIQFTRVT